MDKKEMFDAWNTLKDDFILKNTSKIDVFKGESREILDYLYSHDNPNIIRMGTIVNSILTHRHQTFMFSRGGLVKLFASDINTEYKSINEAEYKLLVHTMLKCGDFIKLREPTKDLPKTKSGVYKVIKPIITQILYTLHGADFFSLQEEAVIRAYDEYGIGEDIKYERGWISNKFDKLSPEEKQKYREMKND